MAEDKEQGKEEVSFLANFPGTQSDIKFGPDGARIILDIPKLYEGAAAQLLRYRETILRVRICRELPASFSRASSTDNNEEEHEQD